MSTHVERRVSVATLAWRVRKTTGTGASAGSASSAAATSNPSMPASAHPAARHQAAGDVPTPARRRPTTPPRTPHPVAPVPRAAPRWRCDHRRPPAPRADCRAAAAPIAARAGPGRSTDWTRRSDTPRSGAWSASRRHPGRALACRAASCSAVMKITGSRAVSNAPELPQRLDAVEALHVRVQRDQVRRYLVAQAEGLRTTRGHPESRAMPRSMACS